MAIIFKVEDDGGFVCGDLGSRITAYAYPTTRHAVDAARSPSDARMTAEIMLSAEVSYRALGCRTQGTIYDDDNWVTLRALQESGAH